MFAFLSSQKSNAGDAVLTTDYDGDYTVKGNGFLLQEWLVGSGATNQSSGGGATEVKANIIRPNSGKTLMEIVNESGNAITFNLVQQLFEI